MRVVIASDSIGPLSSAEAGRLLAQGWAGAGTHVVPMGESGRGFGRAAADLLDCDPRHGAVGELVSTVSTDGRTLVIGVERPARSGETEAGTAPIRPTTSSTAHGTLLVDALADDLADDPADDLADDLAETAGEVVLDLSGNDAHDAGAGFLAALGAIADVPLDGGADRLADLASLDLTAAHRLLAGRALVGVVPASELSQPLLGLRGITSLRGRAAGTDPPEMLRIDASLERFARLVDRSRTEPVTDLAGAGACGGLGLAVLALGGRLLSGPAWCAERGRLVQRLASADLAVTGCTVYDFASRGGGVLAEVSDLATAALVPCIVLAGDVLIGSREMRTMGIEAAYAVEESSGPIHSGDSGALSRLSADGLRSLARRVARSWSW